ISTICFDTSVEQIFITLSSGAVLVLVDKNTLLDPGVFNAFVSRNGITHFDAVPSFLSNMTLTAGSLTALKRIIAGGDTCPVEFAKTWNRYCDFYNSYGTTETTVTSTEILCKTVDDTLPRLPIGKPLNNTTVYLLDRWHKLVPLGVPGELYIGGAGVARGYLNRPELTAEKFILATKIHEGHPSPLFSPSPIAHRPSPLYMSGDLARWLPDGNIDFIGRIDSQVKVRGFRIELAEIELVLAAHPGIKTAVVIIRQPKTGAPAGEKG
ncbi:MAG: amino acid adenylation domain-containing protein, partial [bacterium]|nr:amino acid adenylation domain-containing protein [bacterium]